MSYLQKILFGGPGVGKSHKIASILDDLKVSDINQTKTVFHPEYTYGDFMGKLLPLTVDSKIVYEYYPGYFLQTLAKAYRNILINPTSPEPVALVIDEINRGNSSAIFGTVFQLLDRNEDGWSCYDTKLSKMEYVKLLELIGIEYRNKEYQINQELYAYIRQEIKKDNFLETRKDEIITFQEKILLPLKIKNESIKIPPNMSLIATMNTSDNSIFYMDSAFKRRWDWEYVKGEKQNAKIDNLHDWSIFVDKLNRFFIEHSDSIRQIEDKQIGYWFIKARKQNISMDDIKDKLLFFIWDSVFSRDKTGLKNLLGDENLITFNQFADQCAKFISAIMSR